MFKPLEKLFARFGYVRADQIATAKPVIVTQPQVAVEVLAGSYTVLENGKVLFPKAVDKSGRPIQFERGVSYIVSSNGRWRKRRTAKAKSDVIEDDAKANEEEDETSSETATETGVSLTVSDERGPYGTTKQRMPRNGFRGTGEHKRVYHHWLKLHAKCSTPFNNLYLEGDDAPAMVERWYKFENFVSDVEAMGGIDAYMTIKQIDNTNPFGPENIKFVRPSSLESGHIPKKRKFTDMQIAHIRHSPLSVTQLMNQYGVTAASIRQIKQGLTYKNVH